MRRASVTLAALVLVLAGAACGRDAQVAAGGSTTSSTTSTTAGSSTTSTTPTSPTRPTTPTTSTVPPGKATDADVVLTITSGGGFVPYGADFANVPLKVQRNGAVYTGGAVPAIYPGPAMTPVMTGTLPGAQVRELLAEAKAAGLAKDHLDAGQPGVTDMPTTTIEVEIDGKVHTQSAYALGYDDPQPSSSLTPAQRDARKAMSTFVDHASDVVSHAADHTFVPSAYQVLASKAETTTDSTEVKPNELTWPVRDVPLVAGVACIDVDAAHAGALRDLLPKASQITIWHDGGSSWHLVVRALLPGDATCAARAR